LARRIFPTAEFDRKIAGFASDSVRRVKCSGRVNEKSGAANLAVLIHAMNLNHRFSGLSEKLANLVADRRGGLLLGEKEARA
jgi:hypothetical protein